IAGQTYPVTLQFSNAGPRTWDTAHQYCLQSLNATNNTTWGTNRMPMTNSPVSSPNNGIFGMNVIAPATAGTYNFQWRPYQGDINVGFGPASTNVAVVVTKNADAAR